ncbi:MAG: GDP-mannose 4,6-dehydratase [Armatimonadetes bacterium]|nr:GDP-mannose 4,6-dehydratase [Armatimonadota bacterium]
MSTILLTGAAGFIGWKTGEKLLALGHTVVGVDDLNDYYDVRLKKWRLQSLQNHANFHFYHADIRNHNAIREIFKQYSFEAVMNLAARAGVRYSMKNPWVYYETNVVGNLNLLELSKEFQVPKYLLASTSSLYAGMAMPFEENRPTTTPISPYAASKGSAELSCYTYYYLYDLDVTILRYFTVYGPAGRPDMSVFRFIKWIDTGEEITLYGDGSQSRDFTYVEDIAEGNIKALKPVRFEIVNLGNDNPHPLSEAISLIEKYLGKQARIKNLPFQKTDVKATWANITKARELLGWSPQVSLEEGLKRTVDWYLSNREAMQSIDIDMNV